MSCFAFLTVTVMQRKERNSSIELFRLLSMFLVLVVHADFWFLGRPDLSYGLTASNLSQVVIESLSCVCVNCFILISGYFGIRPNLRSLLQLFTQILFVYVVFYLLSCVLGVVSFSITAFIDNCLAFSKTNWFVQAYLMLVLFAPVLNAFIEKSDKRTLLIFTLLFLAVEFWFGEVRDCEFSGFNNGYSFLHFALLYLLARLLFSYRSNLVRIKKKIWIILYLACSLLISIEIIFGLTINYSNPLVVLSSMSLFLFFISFNFKSKIINWLAVSAFAIYLIHTREPVLSWFRDFDIYAFHNYGYFVFAGSIIGVMLLIFFGSILVDKVRILFVFKINRQNVRHRLETIVYY